jgi:hypothetical protein
MVHFLSTFYNIYQYIYIVSHSQPVSQSGVVVVVVVVSNLNFPICLYRLRLFSFQVLLFLLASLSRAPRLLSFSWNFKLSYLALRTKEKFKIMHISRTWFNNKNFKITRSRFQSLERERDIKKDIQSRRSKFDFVVLFLKDSVTILCPKPIGPFDSVRTHKYSFLGLK